MYTKYSFCKILGSRISPVFSGVLFVSHPDFTNFVTSMVGSKMTYAYMPMFREMVEIFLT